MSEQEPTTRTTQYVILEETGDGTAFQFIQNVAAASSADALRKIAAAAGSGMYVAVPARSFVPTKVTVENKPTIRLG